MTNAPRGCSSTTNRLISDATMMVSEAAIFTAAFARLRRSGGMKSGTIDSASGRTVLTASAYRTITVASMTSDVLQGRNTKSTAASGMPTARYGTRRPHRVRVLSDRLPIQGWMKIPSRLSMPISRPTTAALVTCSRSSAGTWLS
jgi:hypothetical protein